jgi:D-proline reductase (dithiol) PrdB
VSLVSRHLEENGIPTVVVANARDIVEHCGVARLYFTDFPLGSPAGEPFNEEVQRQIVSGALDLLESAAGPRTTVEAPFQWSKGEDWKAKVFSAEQPWKEKGGEAEKEWLAKKELYRKLKAEGKA